MKTILSFLGVILFCGGAQAQSSAEVTCRAQAKELAVQTYSSCVSAARSAQVEKIRNDYQKELTALKNKYDLELKKLAGEKSVVTKAPQAVKGVAKKLPLRSENQEALPVVSLKSGENAVNSSLETSSDDMAEMEIIELPAE